MSITRGYSFGSREFVTSAKLHRLVGSAGITGLTADNFTGDIAGLTQSTPASIADGTLMFLHETSASLTEPSSLSRWIHPTYFIHYFGNWIAIFAGDRLETGRFHVGSDFSGGSIDTGEALLFELSHSGSGSVTLPLGESGTAPPKVGSLGSAIRSADHGSAIRAGLLGYAPVDLSSGSSGSPWFDRIWRGASSAWGSNTASDPSGYFGYRLNNVSGGSTGLQPAYLLGSMIFSE